MVQSLDARATWLVGRAHRRGHALLTEAFSQAGSRPYHYRLLAALAESGPVSQAHLGRLTGIDRSDVSGALQVLGEHGFVVRRPDPTDGRRKLVVATDAAHAELRRLDEVLDGVQDSFLAPLDAAERRSFLDMAGRLGESDGTGSRI